MPKAHCNSSRVSDRRIRSPSRGPYLASPQREACPLGRPKAPADGSLDLEVRKTLSPQQLPSQSGGPCPKWVRLRSWSGCSPSRGRRSRPRSCGRCAAAPAPHPRSELRGLTEDEERGSSPTLRIEVAYHQCIVAAAHHWKLKRALLLLVPEGLHLDGPEPEAPCPSS